MLTFTTPARSQSTPHRAPKTSGVASDSVPANWLLTGNGRSRPAAAQVRNPSTTATPATVAATTRPATADPPAEEARPPRARQRTAQTTTVATPGSGTVGSWTSSNASDSAKRASPRVEPSATSRSRPTTPMSTPVESRWRRFSPDSTRSADGAAAVRRGPGRRVERGHEARPPSGTGPGRVGLAGADERDQLGHQRGRGHEEHDQRLQRGGQRERGLRDALHGQAAGVQGAEEQPGEHGAERGGPAEQGDGDRVEADRADDARRRAGRAGRTPTGRAPPARRRGPRAPPATAIVMTVVRATLMPAVAAACGLAPTARIAKPVVERSRNHQTKTAARIASDEAQVQLAARPAAGRSRSSRRSARSGRCGRGAGTRSS